MNGLLKTSLEEKTAIEIMYMAENSIITKRKIIVTSIHTHYIKAFCFARNQKRTFNLSNILAVAKLRKIKKEYA